MTELGKIFDNHADIDAIKFSGPFMSFDQFKAAVAEVVEAVMVTDEEIDKIKNASHRAGVEWSRDQTKAKLEKLLK